jgi:hypothetical protein
MRRGEPRRLYTYALLDPVDEPYTIFKYFLCGGSARSSISKTPRSSADKNSAATVDKEHLPAPTAIRRRLSVPPRMQLFPSTSLSEPWSPVKQPGTPPPPTAISAIEGYTCNSPRGVRLDPYLAATDPILRSAWDHTPPPRSQPPDKKDYSPPSQRRKDGSMSMLRGVIANALKRREGNQSSDSLVN